VADSVILRDEDVGRIGEYVKPWLRELVHEMAPRNEPDEVSTQVLGAQRELMDERFAFTQERLTTLTWMIGVGFVVITSLTTVFGLLA